MRGNVAKIMPLDSKHVKSGKKKENEFRITVSQWEIDLARSLDTYMTKRFHFQIRVYARKIGKVDDDAAEIAKDNRLIADRAE